MPLRARTPYTRHLSGGGGGAAEEESRTHPSAIACSPAPGTAQQADQGGKVGYAAVGGPRVPAAAPANNHNDSVAR